MRTFRTLLIVVVLLAAAACGGRSPDSPGGGSGSGSSGTRPVGTWVVTSVTDHGRPRPLVDGTEIRFRFDRDRVTITAGCNTMSGTYTFAGNRLTISSLATTEMGCAEPRMAQDAWVSGLFTGPVQFSTGKDAAIVSGSTVLALADRRVVSPDASLVGTRWLLDSVSHGDTASSVPQGIVASVVFAGDGTVRVSDGLNDGSGPVSVVGDRIRFGDLSWTAVGCTDGSCSVGEVSDVFTGTATFAIEEKTLTITNGDLSLGFRAVRKIPTAD